MTARSITPDFSALEIPTDVWSAPFWEAAAEGRLAMPRCSACGTFRWPVGPFCPNCHAQPVAWRPPGAARIYSYTVLPAPGLEGDPSRARIPVLAEFDDAPGVRLVTVLIDTPVTAVSIGARLQVDWLPAANATVPVFRLANPEENAE
ncbi:zinc ribbon domain-containing protein [Phenylobacterium sp. LjRoot219]|uniref:Zn-ribbon domain-containing OB-fold protein n=1 Tax=Phenylobacterium sp. LjRoot219 TaxID=3342283 RepID=UPI003ECCB0C3